MSSWRRTLISWIPHWIEEYWRTLYKLNSEKTKSSSFIGPVPALHGLSACLCLVELGTAVLLTWSSSPSSHFITKASCKLQLLRFSSAFCDFPWLWYITGQVYMKSDSDSLSTSNFSKTNTGPIVLHWMWGQWETVPCQRIGECYLPGEQSIR